MDSVGFSTHAAGRDIEVEAEKLKFEKLKCWRLKVRGGTVPPSAERETRKGRDCRMTIEDC